MTNRDVREDAAFCMASDAVFAKLNDSAVEPARSREYANEVADEVARRLAAAGLLRTPEDDPDVEAEALVDQTRIKGLTVANGTATLETVPPHEIVLVWVEAARKMLGQAPNYVEAEVHATSAVSMEVSAAGEVERYVLTVQRAERVTPHQARLRAEGALAELVRLKDGPRGEAYRAAKDAAWQRARDVLGGAAPGVAGGSESTGR